MYNYYMAQEIQEQLFVGEVAQKAVITKDGKVLLSRDVGMTNWDSPGGRLHFGEESKAGLIREVQEEIGVDVEIGEPFYTGVFTPTNPNKSTRPRFLVAYHATLKDPSQPFVLAPDEIEEVRWVGKDEIASMPMWDDYKEMFKHYFA